jgi:phage repressor protein C with HTH and peptisase S24 domain
MIANITGWSATWILTGEGERLKKTPVFQEAGRVHYGIRVAESTLSGLRVTDDLSLYDSSLFEEFPDITHLVQVNVDGDEMAPVIYRGDKIVIDRSDTVISSGTYALLVEGSVIVHRLKRRHDRAVLMTSENPRYQPETVPPDAVSELVILGRVIHRGGLLA